MLLGGGEWTSSSVPVGEVGLRRNELLRETQSMFGEREREPTVYPVVQLPVLVSRFVGTNRVWSRASPGSIVPSVV